MVDKGYLVHDFLQGKEVELLRPPFLQSGQQFQEEERDLGRSIARHRIVIENVNARVKTYRILAQKVPITFLPQINEIVYVCAILSNFNRPMRRRS